MFIATVQAYLNNTGASCFAGFRGFRGNDPATWYLFDTIHEATGDASSDDAVETIALHFSGKDPSGTYRPYSKGGFVDQVGQYPGAIVGAGGTGFVANPPPAEDNTARIHWFPEGPDRGAPTDPQSFNWTGGVYIGPGGPYTLIGGHTDMAYRFMVRPFPDRQRRISISDHKWELFFGAVTQTEMTGTAGDTNLGPLMLRQLIVIEFSDPKGMAPLGSVLYL